jgi:hypothetical protein
MKASWEQVGRNKSSFESPMLSGADNTSTFTSISTEENPTSQMVIRSRVHSDKLQAFTMSPNWGHNIHPSETMMGMCVCPREEVVDGDYGSGVVPIPYVQLQTSFHPLNMWMKSIVCGTCMVLKG